jgi:hypothetical protein
VEHLLDAHHARQLRVRAGRWPPPRPTSTTTAGQTSTSPTTTDPRSCSATWEASVSS